MSSRLTLREACSQLGFVDELSIDDYDDNNEDAEVGSVVEWLKHRTDDQHGLSSKPTCAILLCPWERHFTALSPAWWS